MGKSTKFDLIIAISEELKLTTVESRAIIETILGSMSEALSRGESIELRGFGTFHVKQYGSYTGRNPKTSEILSVKPKKLPIFKVGKDLREAVNGNHG